MGLKTAARRFSARGVCWRMWNWDWLWYLKKNFSQRWQILSPLTIILPG